MDRKRLISVVIPTFNSEKTLEICLKSVVKQSCQDFEIIVVDSFSRDETVNIAKNYGKVVFFKGGILGARYEGFRRSSGEYVLLLDSDQVLERTALERTLKMIKTYDMLCLEEKSSQPVTFIEKLFEADRELVHELAKVHVDPLDGVLLARFYKRQVLGKAFRNIPRELLPIVVAYDHAIIYYEAFRVSTKVGILHDAVWHIEPSGLLQLWAKNFRYGRSARKLVETGFYRELVGRKVRFRKGIMDSVRRTIGVKSLLLSTLKGIPYEIGYFI